MLSVGLARCAASVYRIKAVAEVTVPSHSNASVNRDGEVRFLERLFLKDVMTQGS